MRLFIISAIIAVLCISILIISPAFADNNDKTNEISQNQFHTKKDETVITYVNINDELNYDIEVLVEKNGNILVPFKQMSAIYGFKLKQNHVTKELEFTTPDGKSGLVGLNSVVFDGKTISTRKNKTIKQGMMDDCKDEIFLDEKTISHITGSKFTTDRNDLTVLVFDERMREEAAPIDFLMPEKDTIKAYTQVIVPNEKKKVTLDAITLRNSLRTDSSEQVYLDRATSQAFYNNMSQFGFNGEAYGGKYVVKTSSYNTQESFYNFAGLTLNYKNKIGNYNYELGELDGFSDGSGILSRGIYGVMISGGHGAPAKCDYPVIPRNKSADVDTVYDIRGQVTSGNYIVVFADDENEVPIEVKTYNGFYSLKDLRFENEPKKIRIEEVNEDGERTFVLEKTFRKYNNFLARGEVKWDHLIGLTGFSNNLFAQDGYVYEYNTNKFLTGVSYTWGLRDNVQLNTKVLNDKIYSKPKNTIWGQDYFKTGSITSFSSFKNTNMLEGSTLINTLDYRVNDNLVLSSGFGFSSSKDTSVVNTDLKSSSGFGIGSQDGSGKTLGMGLEFNADYVKGTNVVRAGIYNYSPDYYVAGSDSGFLFDRRGAKLGGSTLVKGISLNGTINRYQSNLDNQYANGIVDFNEYSLGLAGDIKKKVRYRATTNSRIGQNSAMKLENGNYDIGASARVGKFGILELGRNGNYYNADYSTNSNSDSSIISSNQDFTSNYNDLYTRYSFAMPRGLGSAQISHDMIEASGNNITTSKYNQIQFSYGFPTFKRFSVSLRGGYKYTGVDKGLNYGVTVGYRFPTGTVLNVNYNYGLMNGYMFNDIYVPGSVRHSFYIDLNDTLAVMEDGLRSVGAFRDDYGYVQVAAYLDVNKNGKFDKEDIGVPDVPIKVSWQNKEIFTNSKGKTVVQNTKNGVYNIKLETDKLPATLTLAKDTKTSYIIKVDRQRRTTVEFPLISAVGNLRGTVKIMDDFGHVLNLKDLIVVVVDNENKEIDYANVDEGGEFYISGISPGDYKIMLDPQIQEENQLEQKDSKGEFIISIPYVYKDFVDIADLNLEYQTSF